MSSTHITTQYGLGVFQMHNSHMCWGSIVLCRSRCSASSIPSIYIMYSQNEWSTTPNLLHSVVTTHYLTYSCNSLIYLFNWHCFIFKCNSWDFSKLTFLFWVPTGPLLPSEPYHHSNSASHPVVREGGRGGLF